MCDASFFFSVTLERSVTAQRLDAALPTHATSAWSELKHTWHSMPTRDVHAIVAELAELPMGTNVAVVTLLGSLCPITTGHTQTFEVARRLLLQESEDGKEALLRPAALERFGEVVGFISLNGDRHVEAKLTKKKQPSLDIQQRRHLVNLATSGWNWIGQEDREGSCLQTLRSCMPHLTFIHFFMNGADDVRKYRKWTWADANNRYLTFGRPGDTDAVVNAALRDHIDLDAGYFVMGPELPDVSSTDARIALARGDVVQARRHLHPPVLEWLLAQGPWRLRPHAAPPAHPD